MPRRHSNSLGHEDLTSIYALRTALSIRDMSLISLRLSMINKPWRQVVRHSLHLASRVPNCFFLQQKISYFIRQNPFIFPYYQRQRRIHCAHPVFDETDGHPESLEIWNRIAKLIRFWDRVPDSDNIRYFGTGYPFCPCRFTTLDQEYISLSRGSGPSLPRNSGGFSLHTKFTLWLAFTQKGPNNFQNLWWIPGTRISHHHRRLEV